MSFKLWELTMCGFTRSLQGVDGFRRIGGFGQ